MAVTEKRVSHLEETMQKLAYEHLNTEIIMQNSAREMMDFKNEMKDFKDEMKVFKDEMKVFKDEMKVFRDEMRADRKDLNKKWGELANKMGTIVEDIVAPNIPTIAKTYFGVEDFEDIALYYRKQHPAEKGRIREFDIIAASEKYLFLNETKSTVRQSYLEDFAQNYMEVFDYFPHFRGKTLVPIFSSLRIPENAIRFLTRHGIYAMAMKGDTMDLLNYEEVCNRKQKTKT